MVIYYKLYLLLKDYGGSSCGCHNGGCTTYGTRGGKGVRIGLATLLRRKIGKLFGCYEYGVIKITYRVRGSNYGTRTQGLRIVNVLTRIGPVLRTRAIFITRNLVCLETRGLLTCIGFGVLDLINNICACRGGLLTIKKLRYNRIKIRLLISVGASMTLLSVLKRIRRCMIIITTLSFVVLTYTYGFGGNGTLVEYPYTVPRRPYIRVLVIRNISCVIYGLSVLI